MALKQAKSTKTTAMEMSKTKATMQSSKPHCTSKKQVDSSDPWSFLDLIEAPQWIDLSEEATLSMDSERYDPWFDESHRHHVISLAGKNSDMTWLRLNNSKRADEVEVTSLARNAIKKCQQSAPKSTSTGKTNVELQKKIGSQDPLKTRLLQKEIVCSDANYANRASSSSNRRSVSQSSFSGCSGISVNSSLYKYRRSCSERLSVNSRWQDGQSPGGSVLTVDSTSSYVEEKAATISEETNTNVRKFGDNLKDNRQVFDDPAADSITMKTKKMSGISVHQMAKRVVKYEVNDKDSKREGHVPHSLADSSQRHLSSTGKENKNPEINNKTGRHTCKNVSSSELAIMRKTNVKLGPVKSSSRGAPQSNVGKSSAKSRVVQNLNGSCGVNQKKRVETRHSAVAESISGKPSKPEMDLADLVAQHNQKIQTLRLHGFRKELR